MPHVDNTSPNVLTYALLPYFELKLFLDCLKNGFPGAKLMIEASEGELDRVLVLDAEGGSIREQLPFSIRDSLERIAGLVLDRVAGHEDWHNDEEGYVYYTGVVQSNGDLLTERGSCIGTFEDVPIPYAGDDEIKYLNAWLNDEFVQVGTVPVLAANDHYADLDLEEGDLLCIPFSLEGGMPINVGLDPFEVPCAIPNPVEPSAPIKMIVDSPMVVRVLMSDDPAEAIELPEGFNRLAEQTATDSKGNTVNLLIAGRGISDDGMVRLNGIFKSVMDNPDITGLAALIFEYRHNGLVHRSQGPVFSKLAACAKVIGPPLDLLLEDADIPCIWRQVTQEETDVLAAVLQDTLGDAIQCAGTQADYASEHLLSALKNMSESDTCDLGALYARLNRPAPGDEIA